jgi:hypothetical protein
VIHSVARSGVDMPFCSRRTWKTPAGFTTWPTPRGYDDGVVLPRFQSSRPDGRRRVFIMTTIQTQRPTLPYLYQFYPDKTQAAVPLLSRHSQRSRRSTSAVSTSSRPRTSTRRSAGRQGSPDASTRRSRFVRFTTKLRPTPLGRNPRFLKRLLERRRGTSQPQRGRGRPDLP